MSIKIHDKILKESMVLGINIHLFSDEVLGKIRTKIRSRFAKKHTTTNRWLWEHLDDDKTYNVQNPEAWQWIDEFIEGDEIFMFFDEYESNALIKFDNVHDLVKILGETSHFEFYLTNQQTTYLLCFNHHDFLIGAGTAKIWLEKRTQSPK